MSKESDELYSRGKYRLEWDRKRDGTLRSPFLQIVWYDDDAGRNRSRTTGTADIAAAEDELDKLYLKRELRSFPSQHSSRQSGVGWYRPIRLSLVKGRFGAFASSLSSVDNHH